MKTLSPTRRYTLWPRSTEGVLRLLCVIAMAGISLGPRALAADGPISAVQDALKKENLFLGERTGVLDLPTREALRRFQLKRDLPASGEIDAATLQALQTSTEARQPTIQSLPPGAAPATGPVASEETIAKDREFLQKHQQTEIASAPAPAPIAEQAPPPPVPAQVSPERREALEPPQQSTPSVQTAAVPRSDTAPSRAPKALPEPDAEKPRPTTTRKEERPARVATTTTTERTQRRSPEPIGERAEPRLRTSTSQTKIAERDDDPDLLAPNGVRVIRPESSQPERRTRVVERKTAAIPETTVVEIRRAEPVEMRQKNTGFFHRLFKDKDGN